MNLDTLLPPAQLADFVPLAERAISIDPASMIRFRAGEQTVAGYVRLPYDVLAGRTLAVLPDEPAASFDVTVAAADFVRWVEQAGPVPPRKDAHWLSPLPPRRGWRRVEVVPDSVIRGLVRSGADLAGSATSRQSQESLLASVVLTAAGDGSAPDGSTPDGSAPNGSAPNGSAPNVEVRLGALTALTRMGFVPRDSEVGIDAAPGWVRVAAGYGSTYVSDGKPLGLLTL